MAVTTRKSAKKTSEGGFAFAERAWREPMNPAPICYCAVIKVQILLNLSLREFLNLLPLSLRENEVFEAIQRIIKMFKFIKNGFAVLLDCFEFFQNSRNDRLGKFSQ
ncbi:hypothetical protein OFO12_05490 [Campylobacter sp. JMF_04 NA10]|uniref:hypothetical protein n=1 Tax=Campylobacter sp. JMF_04 NA10 TaxID=2983824 RepID=UPI0022E9F299|nr:hypothetical protein [Campylobacter sp. JMF_04 NA10]MDA3076822.1 hypothetical protein [Campylobacter sp. JMF_04 NA10]